MDESHARQVRLKTHQLRLLAHPLRSRLLAALRGFGPATATALAVRLDSNSGATSYHLRQLAQAGLVTEDRRGGRGGPRWWRSVHEATTWTDVDFDADPNDRAAADWAAGQHVRLTTRWVEDWLAARREWSREWRASATLSDQQLRVTPQGLERLVAELQEVIDRYRLESESAAHGAERCAIILHAFPASDLRI